MSAEIITGRFLGSTSGQAFRAITRDRRARRKAEVLVSVDEVADLVGSSQAYRTLMRSPSSQSLAELLGVTFKTVGLAALSDRGVAIDLGSGLCIRCTTVPITTTAEGSIS